MNKKLQVVLTWCIEEVVSISVGVYSHRSVGSVSECIKVNSHNTVSICTCPVTTLYHKGAWLDCILL